MSSTSYAEVWTTVSVALRVARMHSSSITVQELLQLLPSGTRAADVVAALEGSPGFSSSYTIREGLVVPNPEATERAKEYELRKEYSTANIGSVKWFTSKVGGRSALAISISGSTSYRAASKGDDTDLFCITPSGTMWVFLAKALLFARISGLLRKNTAPICLSCMMDRDFAQRMFSRDQGALFARDALVSEVIFGANRYAGLLESARWMEEYFPKLYAMRRTSWGRVDLPDVPASMWTRFVNTFLFFTLGNYIRAKVFYHNRMLEGAQRPMAKFHARMGADHLIYESEKYLKLKAMYDEIHPRSGDAGPV